MRFVFCTLALAVGGARGAGPSLRFAPTQTHGPVGMPNVAEAPTLNLENRYADRHEPYPVPGHGLVGGGGGGGGAATTYMGGCDQYARQACAGLEYCFDNSWPKYDPDVADDDVRRAIPPRNSAHVSNIPSRLFLVGRRVQLRGMRSLGQVRLRAVRRTA